MQPTSNKHQNERKHRAWIFGLYFAFFALFFWGVHSGLGQYWDWSFPYFSDQLSALFTNKASSWIAADMGSPLGYATDYFLRFVIALFAFLPPETVRYGLLVLVFAAGGLGMYLLTRRHTGSWLAFSLGLAAFINPAIFYKYTAGHINYLVAFTIFIYFVYFLLYKFDKTMRSAVITGLFIAALGVQIQFFIIGGIFLLLFFLFNRSKLGWRYLAVLLLIPIFIHAVWLANFVTGAVSTAETSSTAAKVSVRHSMSSSFLDIFTFSFSKATLLAKFYAFYELLWNAALFIFMLWLLVRKKQHGTATIVLLVFLAIMIFLATGMYRAIDLGPLTTLYPMLREVGHFAPVIVLAVLILIARLVQQSRWRWTLTCLLIGSFFIVGIKFQYYSQAYSFDTVRDKFAPFKSVADQDKSDYRILTYPLFGKYSFNHLPKNPETIFPLKNSGHDSFAAFSRQEFINNTVAPHEFKESIQYKLLQDYDIDVLRPYNVKYIFDFSGIYESDYNRYAPATVYNNDISLIKNDKEFFNKLLARNPGKLRKINDRVLEIKEYIPRVHVTPDIFTIPNKEQARHADSFTRRALGKPLDYTPRSGTQQAAYTTRLMPLFSEPKRTRADRDSGTFTQSVAAGESVYANTSYAKVLYELTDGQLTIFTDTPGSLLLNNQPITSGSEGRRPILQLPADSATQYYLSFKGTVTPIVPGRPQAVGIGKEGDKIEIFAAQADSLIRNASFENELWKQKVSDCNKYDGDAKLTMQRTTQTASQGQSALELTAKRHNACTDIKVKLAANTQYLLSFDYQSPNAQTANFFFSYGTDNLGFAKGFRAITDDKWHTLTKLIATPDQAGDARLFFYALEQDGKQTTVNRYDNVSLIPLQKIQDSELPTQPNPYKKIELASSAKQVFTYTDSKYTYRNLIANPSFERGPWQPAVSNCNKYDDRPDISMRIRRGAATAGKQSLELQAKRHDACTRTTANVTENTDYWLTFDYQTDGAKYYGYAVSYDDPQATVTREQLRAAPGNGWHRAKVKIRAPARASALTLYLYAFDDGGKRNTVRYDNVNLVELPDFSDRFYVVEHPEHILRAPRQTTFTGSHPAQKNIRIVGATKPFFVTLSETYNPKWRLQLATPQVTGIPNRWLPTAKATTIGKHFEANDYMNGWLVDPAALCQNGAAIQSGCTKNADGSYDIRLVAEFAPQRWFAVAAFVSWTTLILCATYLFVTRGQESPTYQLAWRQLLRRRKGR